MQQIENMKKIWNSKKSKLVHQNSHNANDGRLNFQFIEKFIGCCKSATFHYMFNYL